MIRPSKASASTGSPTGSLAEADDAAVDVSTHSAAKETAVGHWKLTRTRWVHTRWPPPWPPPPRTSGNNSMCGRIWPQWMKPSCAPASCTHLRASCSVQPAAVAAGSSPSGAGLSASVPRTLVPRTLGSTDTCGRRGNRVRSAPPLDRSRCSSMDQGGGGHPSLLLYVLGWRRAPLLTGTLCWWHTWRLSR